MIGLLLRPFCKRVYYLDDVCEFETYWGGIKLDFGSPRKLTYGQMVVGKKIFIGETRWGNYYHHKTTWGVWINKLIQNNLVIWV